MTIGIAAGRVNRPSASSGPPTSCVSEMAGAQSFPGPIAVAVELRRQLGEIVRRDAGGRGTAQTCCASPCGTSASPTAARSSASAHGASAS